jgi:hypothetical protein
VEVLRWCIDWLDRLERGEEVMVNLRPDTDPERAFVRFDRPRVLRVLARIAADLDALAGRPTKPVADDSVDNKVAARVRHRRRLVNPNRRSHNLASVNNVQFCGNSSGYRLMKPAKLGDRSTLSTKLDGLVPLMVPLLPKPQIPEPESISPGPIEEPMLPEPKPPQPEPRVVPQPVPQPIGPGPIEEPIPPIIGVPRALEPKRTLRQCK